MGFWEGFADGFESSFNQARDREERRKLFLDEQAKKREANLAPVLAKLGEKKSELAMTGTQMEYLQSRGLDPKTLDVIYGDPDALGEAYEILRTEGADWDTETTNSYIRASASTKDPSTPWNEHFRSTMDLYQGLNPEDLNPTTLTQVLTETQPSPQGVVEVRPRPKAKADAGGVDPEMIRRWGEQETLFNNQVVELGQNRLSQLEAKIADGTATETDFEQRAVLARDIGNYGKADNPSATLTLRKMFAPVIIQSLQNAGVQPEVLAGIELNPRLYTVGEGGETTLANPTETEAVEEAPAAVPVAVEEIDGKTYHYFTNETGGYRRVRVK